MNDPFYNLVRSLEPPHAQVWQLVAQRWRTIDNLVWVEDLDGEEVHAVKRMLEAGLDLDECYRCVEGE